MAIAVAACIITYRRPRGLERLLSRLAHQTGVERSDFLVVVVDNDRDQSALPIVESARASGLALEYHHEPTPGIPQARNRSVSVALGRGAERICFIDDDEFPEDSWLERLIAHSNRGDAGAVVGPVVSVLPEQAPQWLRRSRVFSRRRFPTGHRLDRARTGNALVHRRVFDSMSCWFDEAMPLTGGTDTDFFRRADLAGFAIEWCDEAVVYEEVPAERCNLRWIARRMLRGGLGFARLTHAYGNRFGGAVRNLAVGSARMAWGIVLLVVSLGLAPTPRLRGVENVALGAGLVLGTFGISIDEYRRPAQAGDGDR